MIRRAIGLILILVGLSGLALCYLGVQAGRELIDDVALSAEGVVETASATLTTVEDSLEHSRQTIGSITETIDLVQATAVNLASTVDDTEPMLDELTMLVGQDIPSTIGDVQDTIPNIAQTAKVVDDTLRLLSKLKVEETIPLVNYKISFGLGVEYDPEIPFDQAVEDVGRGLGPIAVTSGNLEGELRTTKANMALLSQDLTALAADLDRLNEEVGAFRPLLDEYSTLVGDMQGQIAAGEQRLNDQVLFASQATIVVAVWLSMSQLMPLFFGLELLLGNRMVRPVTMSESNSEQLAEEGQQELDKSR